MSERLSIRRSAIVALLLSLVLPGAGHLYCGKRGTGLWILALFALAVALVLWTPIFIIQPVAIYIFASVDAFLTTREYNSGRGCLPGGNPRIAFVLNLLTGGFGYFYLGERKLGMFVFVFTRFLTPVLGLASWAPQALLAVHAFTECKRLYADERERIAAHVF